MRFIKLASVFVIVNIQYLQIAKALSPDETAMVLGTLYVAASECQINTTNIPLNVEVARLGQDLADFMPKSRYDVLVSVKMKKAHDYIHTNDKTVACSGMVEVIERFLPGIIEKTNNENILSQNRPSNNSIGNNYNSQKITEADRSTKKSDPTPSDIEAASRKYDGQKQKDMKDALCAFYQTC